MTIVDNEGKINDGSKVWRKFCTFVKDMCVVTVQETFTDLKWVKYYWIILLSGSNIVNIKIILLDKIISEFVVTVWLK